MTDHPVPQTASGYLRGQPAVLGGPAAPRVSRRQSATTAATTTGRPTRRAGPASRRTRRGLRCRGDATVFTFTLVHRGHGQFNDEVPYAIVMAKLAEEPRACLVLGNTRGIPNEDLHIGMPVKIVYEDIPDEDVTLWRFGPR